MKFKAGDVIKCRGEHFSMREIMGVDKEHNKYITKFLEDGSIVDSDANIIDNNYLLVEKTTRA